ncbi:MAG: DUF2196 domain-containing protein [Candidatus Nitrosopelagicus sp.]|nr:MAG: DUF2196 domain-containing protein [Candidatus Nitrosopelagicus sp.]
MREDQICSKCRNIVECKECRDIINNPNPTQKKYQLCVLCGKRKYPTLKEIFPGATVVIKKEDGTTVTGKVSEILTNLEWHYEGLRVKIESGVVGRVKVVSKTREKIQENQERRKYGKEVFAGEEKDDEVKIEDEDIFLSKSQAHIIKKIYQNFVEEPLEKDFESFKMNFKDSDIEFVIKDNWYSLKEFYRLATSFDMPNPISLAVVFIRIKKWLRKTPNLEEIEEISYFTESDFKEHFGGWPQFLDRMGENPWESEQKRPKKYKETEKNQVKPLESFEDKEIRKIIIERYENNAVFRDIFPKIERNLKLLSKSRIEEIIENI